MFSYSFDGKGYMLGLGLHGKVLVMEEGVTGVTSVRSSQKFPPCLTEKRPDGWARLSPSVTVVAPLG